MSEKPVYSSLSNEGPQKETKKKDRYQSSKGPCKIRLEKKGRAGKTVTVIYDLPFSFKEAQSFMKELQAYLACGATMKNSCLEFRGDNKEKIRIFCKNKKIEIRG